MNVHTCKYTEYFMSPFLHGSVDISLSSKPIISILLGTVKIIKLSKMINYSLLFKDRGVYLFNIGLVFVAY